MTMDNIYNLLQLWFVAWLLFRCYELISRSCAKIAASLRQKQN